MTNRLSFLLYITSKRESLVLFNITSYQSYFLPIECHGVKYISNFLWAGEYCMCVTIYSPDPLKGKKGDDVTEKDKASFLDAPKDGMRSHTFFL